MFQWNDSKTDTKRARSWHKSVCWNFWFAVAKICFFFGKRCFYEHKSRSTGMCVIFCARTKKRCCKPMTYEIPWTSLIETEHWKRQTTLAIMILHGDMVAFLFRCLCFCQFLSYKTAALAACHSYANNQEVGWTFLIFFPRSKKSLDTSCNWNLACMPNWLTSVKATWTEFASALFGCLLITLHIKCTCMHVNKPREWTVTNRH